MTERIGRDLYENALARFAEPDVHLMWRPQLADPADELVLEAAVTGRASAIVTATEVPLEVLVVMVVDGCP